MGTHRTALPCEVILYGRSMPEAAKAAWDMLHPPGPHTPLFLRSEWMAMAMATGAANPGIVLVLRDADGPFGLVPLQGRTTWSAEITAPIAPDTMPLLMRAGKEMAVQEALADWIKASRYALIRLGRFPREHAQALGDVCRRHALHPLIRQVYPTYRATLTASWEAYLKGMSRHDRYNLRHAEEKILADYPNVTVETYTDPDTGAEAVDAMIRLNRMRWSGENTPSFLNNPRIAELLRQFTLWTMAQGYGRVLVLRLGNRIISTAAGMHIPGQDVVYYHMVGRDPTALTPQHSPGIMLAARIIRWAIDLGAATLALGQGYAPYKVALGCTEYAQWDVTVAKSAIGLEVMKRLDPAIQLTKLYAKRVLTRS